MTTVTSFEDCMLKPTDSNPSGGVLAMLFVGQIVGSAAFSLVLSYLTTLQFEQYVIQNESAVWLFRRIALVVPMAIGFALGWGVGTGWPWARPSGRFVWIFPSVWFAFTFFRVARTFSVPGAINEAIADGGALDMWLGTCFYSVGVVCSSRRAWRQSRRPGESIRV